MASYKEQTDIYAASQVMKTANADITGINAGKMLKEWVQDEKIKDITIDNISVDLDEVLENISDVEEKYICIYKGKLYYVPNETIKSNEEYMKWCRQIKIPILGQAILSDEPEEPDNPSNPEIAKQPFEVTDGSYKLVNGTYLCTPDLSMGFDEKFTRYMEVGSGGQLVPGNWISDKPTNNWYNYKESKWANIYVEKDSNDAYFVWIPRYCFKLNDETQGAETSEVRFIDLNNNYKDGELEENAPTVTWETLEAQGWQIPEAFWWDKDGDEEEDEDEQLPGYWAMKYEAGDTITPSIVSFNMAANKGKITINNLNTNSGYTSQITKYTVALNGEIIDGDIGTVELSGLKKGDNTINVTGLNANGEIVGSMTKLYSTSIVNEPELSGLGENTGFDKNTTFYVTYDDNGEEHSTTPISMSAPDDWYEYAESRWANIVTRLDGNEIYYVWIPRYQFILDQTNHISTVQFIQGTSTETKSGYQIPEAFEWDTDGDGTPDVQLKGFWAMKYEAGDVSAPKFDTEVVATSSTIRTRGIIGTEVGTGQEYNYYLNGVKKGTSTNSSEEFEYTGLTSGTKYTILVEVRETSGNKKLLGTIVKQISTVEPNAPDLSGFNEADTYYVTYDSTGTTPTIGANIKKDGSNMPAGWYDYSRSRWANIVIQKNGNKVYLVWIPRYEFQLTAAQQANASKGKSEVRFIPTTTTNNNCSLGYQVPEAFEWDTNGDGNPDVQLSGFWAMKYEAGEQSE